MAKNYADYQNDAKLLGIAAVGNMEELKKVVEDQTSPEAVGKLLRLVEEQVKDSEKTVLLMLENDKAIANLGEEVEELQANVVKLEGEGAPPPPTDEAALKIKEMCEVQLADRNTRTEPYLTGLYNGMLKCMGIIAGVDNSEKLIKPVTQVSIEGAKVPSNRERLIKEAKKYIYMNQGIGQLRSGLNEADIKKAKTIMEALGVKKGIYNIPAE